MSVEVSKSLFVPGVRVAISQRWRDAVREAFVEKVYKNGNFTLLHSTQQWRPFGPRPYRTAFETGSSLTRSHIQLWDATTDREIAAKVKLTRNRRRLAIIMGKLKSVEAPTDDLLIALERATVEINDE
jgi:hypothetical protein